MPYSSVHLDRSILPADFAAKSTQLAILHTFGESSPATMQSSLARPSRLSKRGNRTVETGVLNTGKYLWKDGGEVDRSEIIIGFARGIESSRW